MSTTDFDGVVAAITSIPVGSTFSTDAIHPLLRYEPAEPNVIGAAFRHARKVGLIQGTEQFVKSRRRESKGRRVQLWLRIPPAQLALED